MCGTKWSHDDRGAICNIYGASCNRLFATYNNDMWQNGGLHLFYIFLFFILFIFFFSYMMNTHLRQ